MRIDVENCRTHVLPVAVPKTAPEAGERQAKCFGKPHSQARAAAILQSTDGISVFSAKVLTPRPLLLVFDGENAILS
jgi:hypothetical protein